MILKLFKLTILCVIICQTSFSQVVTVLWIQGELSREINEGKWEKLNKDDEINFTDKIQLSGEESEVFFRITGKENLNISGPLRRATVKDVYEFDKEEVKNQENKSWFYDLLTYSTKEGYGDISGVSRGTDGITFNDPKKKQFYIGEEIDVLKDHDAVIYWEPTNNNDQVYRIKFSKYFEDTAFITSDTLITIKKNLLSDCSPCDLIMNKPSNSYNHSKIELYYSYLPDSSSSKLKILDSLIHENPNITSYKYAKIQLLVQEGFIANAHYYFLKYMNKADEQMVNGYTHFLNTLHKNYFTKD